MDSSEVQLLENESRIQDKSSESFQMAYEVRYGGRDEQVQTELQNLQVLGNYTKQSTMHDDVPVYAKNGDHIYLVRSSNGHWVFSYFVSNNLPLENGIMYQENNGSPTLLLDCSWKSHDKIFTSVSLVLTPIQKGQGKSLSNDDSNDNDKKTSDTGLVVGIIIAVLVLSFAFILTILLVKKKLNND